jgi:hypothetical protein
MKRIDKKKVMSALVEKLEQELEVAINAAKVAHEDATNEESKPENEYDTRALEASYVARGQAKRVAEIKEALYEFKHTELQNFGDQDRIRATAMILVESEGKEHVLFFMPKGGGFAVDVDGVRVQVVTPSTPLGEVLLQNQKGDGVVVELGDTEKEYEILDLW